MRFFFTLVGALVVAGAGRNAMAQAPAPREQEALTQFEQGKEFFNEGKYEQAAIALARAYELRPHYKILYFLGMAEAENGNYARAYEAYERYLSDVGSAEDPARAAEVGGEMARLSSRIGYLSVSCPKDGAKIKVDGETKGTTPLSRPIKVSVGAREIEVVDGATVLLREVVRIAGGMAITLEVPITPVAKAVEETAPEPAAVPRAPAIEAPPPRRRVWTYVVGGVALGAGLASGVLGGLALSKEEDLRRRCDGSTCDSSLSKDADAVRGLALATDILWISAAATGATAIVLFFVEGRREERTAARLVPYARAEAAGLALIGRF